MININSEKLKKLRADRGYSLAKLGTESGLSAPYIFELENGGRTNPSLTTLTKLAKALNCKIDDLIE